MKEKRLKGSTKCRRTRFVKTALGISVMLVSGPSFAHQIYKGSHFDATINTTLYEGIQYGTGLNYGAGVNGDKQRTNLESAIEPDLNLSWTQGQSTFYGELSIIGAGTGGDGSLGGNSFTAAGDTGFETEQAHVGWRYKDIDLSAGAQDFTVGDGFIISDGNFDTGATTGEYWITPHTAWRNSAILRVNTKPLRGDAFYLKAGKSWGYPELAGGDVAYTLPGDTGTLGAMYFNIFKDQYDRFGVYPYAGMDVYTIRAHGIQFPFLPNMKFYSEYAHQGGKVEGTDLTRDANAWYFEGAYQFKKVRWTPELTYRYSHFSGAKQGQNAALDYQGLFYFTSARGWDTWYQGEIAGEYQLFNENQNTQMVKLKAYPNDQWDVALIYFNNQLDQPQYYGQPLTSTDWSNEVNLEAEYYPTKNLYILGLVGWAAPGAAAKQVYGSGQDFTVAEAYLQYTF